MTVKSRSKGMVDVTAKRETVRKAAAQATLQFTPKSFKVFSEKGSPKGDLFETARVAGIMAAKNTPQIIPLCHPLELGKTEIQFKVDQANKSVIITSDVKYRGRTGVEMEALSAVSASAFTIYDMMKFSDKGMKILDIKLVSKSGRQSGGYKAK